MSLAELRSRQQAALWYRLTTGFSRRGGFVLWDDWMFLKAFVLAGKCLFHKAIYKSKKQPSEDQQPNKYHNLQGCSTEDNDCD